ncbi:MAG: NUDIX domain-containing protein [Ruminococcus sp.]|nr:NUDIX domain-containing protein [Ruminococcus sp.]
MNSDEQIIQYLDFIKEYGLPYKTSDIMRIITDYDELVTYSDVHNVNLGLIYKSNYNIFVVDLVENVRGERFTYERIVKTRRGNSVVVVPMIEDKFVLLKQFRHTLGNYQFAFPRGYGEPDISVEDNVKKEISEELNASASEIEIIGKVVADSGICGEAVNVIRCKINQLHVDGIYEGIKTYYLMSSTEINQYIKSGLITDGFTLSAWSILKNYS